MFKKISVLFVIVLLMLCPVISVSASDLGVQINTVFAEPSVDDNSGYIALTQSAGPYVYYWTITPNITSSNNSKMQLTINNGQIIFNAYAVGASQLSLWAIGINNGRLYNVCTVSFQDSYEHREAMGTPTAYTVKGNCSRIVDNVYGQNHAGVAIVWSSGGTDVEKLIEIHNSINGVFYNTQGTNTRLDSMVTQLNNLTSEVDNVEETLNSMYSIMSNYYDLFDEKLQSIYARLGDMVEEQKKTNTWLEKIFNFLEEKDEKDKEAATQQGNQSSKDVSDMIQDESSEGFKDSLGGLTASMSYSGTECSWSFPTVKLPAIPGVMDEVTLIREQDIDFSYWVNSLPSFILLLVQSVCTAALIIFCFKELYGAISYVLTLKGGGNSE